MSRIALSALMLTLVAAPVRADDWKPAPGPLLTRWAKDVTPDKVLPEYPRPQMVRDRWQNLNGLWQFAEAQKDEAPPLGKELSGRILVPFPVESALSGVMKRAERVWYRRTFRVPDDWKGQRVLLHFGAVDWQATVWLNGTKLGDHRGGYDAFTFDLTDHLKAGSDQELVVGVFDPTDGGPQPRGKQVRRPGGIYYTPTTGIWQTVWLEPVPKAHIAALTIVPDVSGKQVKVAVRLTDATDKQEVLISGSFQHAKGVRTLAQIVSNGGRVFEETHTIPLEDIKLWSPESPHLYDLKIELRENGQTIDTVTSYFGMRQISIGPDDKGVTRILLNGKPYFMTGPLDQGFWPDGTYTAPTDEALKFDIEMTKKLGFNMTRKHVKVEPARWYYWCDKLGLVVWQDMPSGDRGIGSRDPDLKRSPESAAIYERELRAMIAQHASHPCIVMWVPFNEGWGQFDTKRIVALIQKLDPTRLVDCASGWADRGVGSVHDIHVYPGPGSPKPEANRAAVLGEFGGLGLPTPGHMWSNKNWGYRDMKNKDELTRRYERLLARVWKLKNNPGLSAAVYTQITDVETEANGLLTYDRAVVKVDLERAAAANRGDLSRIPEFQVLVPTSERQPQAWRYTTQKPAAGWFKPDFDDTSWREGQGGFGTNGTPGAVVRTEWNTGDIWLRRTVQLADLPAQVMLRLHHDEDAEVYLNGVLAARVRGYVTAYEEVPISTEARKALHPGMNRIAVHCHQTTGGQYIDVGLVGEQPPRK